MKRIMNVIEAEMKKRSITKTCVAKHVNVSPAMITKWFKNENLINLSMFLKIIKFVFGNEDRELIRRYLNTCDKKFDIEVMEWCYSNGEMELLDLALEKDKKRGGSDIGLLYSLLKKRRMGQISHQQFHEDVDNLKMNMKNLSQPNLQVLMTVCSYYAYEGLYAYQLLLHITKETLIGLDNIKSEYLKKSYYLRLNESVITSAIRRKDIDYALKVIHELMTKETKNEFPTLYISLCALKAEALMFDDYKGSIACYKEIMEMFDEDLKSDIERRKIYTAGHDFIKIVNRDFDELYLDDPEEFAHFLASQEDEVMRNQALEILEGITNEIGYEDMFHKYFKALAKRDLELMEQAERAFLCCADFFYADIPRKFIDEYRGKFTNN
jgi:hypothetical protein